MALLGPCETAPRGDVGPVGVGSASPDQGGAVVHPAFRLRGRDLVVRQVPAEGLACRLWPAALGLCDFLDRCWEEGEPGPPLAGLRVLEVGAGTGLAGIAAASLGAEVLLTDLPWALPFLAANLGLNAGAVSAGGGSARVQQLRWGEAADTEAVGELDLVLGADVVYHEHLFEPLVASLRHLARRSPSSATAQEAALWQARHEALHSALRRHIVDPRHQGGGGQAEATSSQGCSAHCDMDAPNPHLEDTTDTSCQEAASPPPSTFAEGNGAAAPAPGPCEQEGSAQAQHAAQGAPLVLLAHVRRFGKDRRFWKLLRKHFQVDQLGSPSGSQKGGVKLFLLSRSGCCLHHTRPAA